MIIKKIKASCKNCGVIRHLEASGPVICECGSEMNIMKYNVFKRKKGAGIEKPKKKAPKVKKVVARVAKPATIKAKIVAKVKKVLAKKEKGNKHGKKNRSKND